MNAGSLPSQQTAAQVLRLVAGQVCIHACMAGMRMAAPLWALPAGRFADRHGLRRPVMLAIGAAMVGGTLSAVFVNFYVLCLSALLMGGATGGASIALQRHVGRAAHDARELRRVFSLLSIGPAVSNFLGPVSVGLLIDHAGVWLGGSAADRNGFVAAFALCALAPALAWLAVRDTPELPAVQVPEGGSTSAWPLLREPLMRRLLVVNWLLSSCWDVHTFVVPVLGHERGFSASVIGTILGGFAVAAASVRVLLPLLANHLREWAVVTSAMVITAVLFGIYPFMPSAWTMGMCSVLLGLALGTVQPMLMSTLHQITPHAQHGQAIALRLMSINISSVLMPMVFGTVGVVVGVSVVFWTVGALVGLGSQAAFKLRPKLPVAPVDHA
jgi:MFS family permease